MRLGGPPPKLGDQLVTGYKVFRRLFVVTVVAVHETPQEWAALCRGTSGRFSAIDCLDLHTGNWRTADRRHEHPDESDKIQTALRARWAGEAS